MSGIQVNPSRTSELAMQTFGENYTQMVAQLAEARAFGEAAQNRVTELELQKSTDEEALNAARETIQRLTAENHELRSTSAEPEPSDEPSGS